MNEFSLVCYKRKLCKLKTVKKSFEYMLFQVLLEPSDFVWMSMLRNGAKQPHSCGNSYNNVRHNYSKITIEIRLDLY